MPNGEILEIVRMVIKQLRDANRGEDPSAREVFAATLGVKTALEYVPAVRMRPAMAHGSPALDGPAPKTPPTDGAELAAEPSRREVLALAFLADVEPRKARRALIEGSGAIRGEDGYRIAIALDAMPKRPIAKRALPPPKSAPVQLADLSDEDVETDAYRAMMAGDS